MDYYEILQVDRRADPEVIRAAYRVLALRNHPDHGGDPRNMGVLNEAWATLGDPKRRSRYDAARRREAAIAEAAAAAAAAAAAGRSTSRPEPEPAGVGVMRPKGTASRNPSPVPPIEAVPPAARPAANRPDGTSVLDFGRYSGWSLTDLGRHDPDYLLWLERTPIGRPYRAEIQRALGLGERSQMATATVTATRPRPRGRWFR